MFALAGIACRCVSFRSVVSTVEQQVALMKIALCVQAQSMATSRLSTQLQPNEFIWVVDTAVGALCLQVQLDGFQGIRAGVFTQTERG